MTTELVNELRTKAANFDHYEVCARAADEIERLRRIEEKALIWSAYQDDDSLKDQAKDPWLKSAAIEAAQALYEAVS